MKIRVNDMDVHLPESTADVTLGQAISYHQQYGKELTQRYREIVELESEEDQDLAIAQWNLDKMYCAFAFYAGCTVEAVKASPFLDEVHKLYSVLLKPLTEVGVAISYERRYEWKGQTWELPRHDLQHGDPMTFGELIDSKQLVKDAVDAGQDMIEYLPKICAIFLRKAGEEYQESFLYQGSERLQLMHELPLSIAMEVAFFFIRSMMLPHNSLSLVLLAPKVVESSKGHTWPAGAGSISSKESLQPRSLISRGGIASTVRVPVEHLTSWSMLRRRKN